MILSSSSVRRVFLDIREIVGGFFSKSLRDGVSLCPVTVGRILDYIAPSEKHVREIMLRIDRSIQMPKVMSYRLQAMKYAAAGARIDFNFDIPKKIAVTCDERRYDMNKYLASSGPQCFKSIGLLQSAVYSLPLNQRAFKSGESGENVVRLVLPWVRSLKSPPLFMALDNPHHFRFYILAALGLYFPQILGMDADALRGVMKRSEGGASSSRYRLLLLDFFEISRLEFNI